MSQPSFPLVLVLALVVASIGIGCNASGSDSPDAAPDAGSQLDATPAPDAGDDADADAASARGPWDIEPGCNPYAYREDCLFPFPSDVFMVEDDTTPSGRRLALPLAAQVQANGGPADPTSIRVADGAPQHPGIFVFLEEGFADQFPEPQDAAAHSPTAEGKTLLIEADSGELVPHFAEAFAGWRETTGKILALRPLGRLRPGTRYVVALRDLHNLAGLPIDAPDGFRQMLAGDLGGAPQSVVDEAARLHAEILPVLDDAGVPREQLVLAWDFTTATEQNYTRDLLHMRDDAVARLDAVSPQIRINRIIEGEDLEPHLRDTVYRQIEGELLAVPSYLEDIYGQRLRRSDDGLPLLAGNAAVPFTAIVPASVAANIDEGPYRIVQFGHGFLGNRHEISDNYQYLVANRLRYVIVAVDWWGFSRDDLANIVPRLSGNLPEAFLFGERLAQAMINQVALEYAIAGALQDHDALKVDGKRTYDSAWHYFLGVSGGGIFGGTFAALATRISRFVFNVGGSSFSMLMSRSDAFGALSTLLRQSIGELQTHKVVALAPYALDPVDAVVWGDRLEGKRVLMQIGLGDAAVPTLASEVAARSIRATLLTPSPRETALLPTSPGPITGNGLVIVDFGVDPEVGRPWKSISVDTTAHEGVRRFLPMAEQMDIFFSPDGEIVQTCDGPCVAAP